VATTLFFKGTAVIFFTDDDCCRYYLLLQEGTCRFCYRIHALCLMTDHIQLAVQVGSTPLSGVMQNLSFRYARWINWRKKRTGHLFQGRYKAVLIDGDGYLLELIRYIHLNPVRTGMVTDPEEYLLSGHRAYLGMEILPWLTTDRVLVQFGESVARAQARYKSFIMDGLGEEHRPEFQGGQKDSRLLVDDHFLDKCLSGSEMLPCQLSIQEIVNRVCRNYCIRVDMLQDPSQRRIASEARAVVGWLARELGYCTLSDVGRLFKRDVGSISSAVRRLSERMQKDSELVERVTVLKAELETKLNNLEA
jgi:REP element-mobilizing transposase RayT